MQKVFEITSIITVSFLTIGLGLMITGLLL
jgi:hypothetical protein